MKVLFLWHMHQPLYRILEFKGDGILHFYPMPWVFLHGIREYYDMLKIVEEIEEARVTFNIVPSLLLQLEEYAEGIVDDQFYEIIAGDPSSFTQAQLVFMLKNFFALNAETQIKPFPRFRELLERRGKPFDLEKKTARFNTQDYLDLQVLYLLANFSEVEKERDPFVRELVRKGRDFTQEEKVLLLKKAQSILRQILPLLLKLQDEGRIEISTTPFYHPILPLLCNTDIAKVSNPYRPLPAKRFSYPADAEEHVRRALSYMEEKLGRRPCGMWPAEAAVSEDAVRIFVKCGVSWIATDEGILERSLSFKLRANGIPSDKLFKVYEFDGLRIFFRDKELSDRIGFVYQKFEADEAVSNFMDYLWNLKCEYKDKELLVTVALDGENPWPYYHRGGLDFLRKLYRKVGDSTYVDFALFSEVEAKPESLSKIFPGSWIRQDFSTWIGCEEKNRAWEYLVTVREELDGRMSDEAYEEILAAEGSDWFWWYGDENPSLYAKEFDRIFRAHLAAAYRLSGIEPPLFLEKCIKKEKVFTFKRYPAAFFTPVHDGRVTDYFEWLPAGEIDLSHVGETEEKLGESILSALFFGYDKDSFHLRVDSRRRLSEVLEEGHVLKIFICTERGEYQVNVKYLDGKFEARVLRRVEDGFTEEATPLFAVDKVLELSLPYELIGDCGPELYIVLEKEGEIVERYPASGFFVIPSRRDVKEEDWII